MGSRGQRFEAEFAISPPRAISWLIVARVLFAISGQVQEYCRTEKILRLDRPNLVHIVEKAKVEQRLGNGDIADAGVVLVLPEVDVMDAAGCGEDVVNLDCANATDP